MFSKKPIPTKLAVVSGALFASSIIAINPQQADASSNVESLVKNAENLATALKWEISYDHRKIAYPNNVFGYPNMKLFNETKSAMFKAEKAVNSASGGQKEALKARLEQNVKTHYDRAVRYIDAVTAGKRILAKSNALNEKLSMNMVDDSAEKAYHALSREIKDRSPIMYKTYGKSSRDALVNHYQLPAYQAKEAALYPVSIKIELDRLNMVLEKKDTDQSIYHSSRLDKFFAEAVSEGYLDKDSSIYNQLADAYNNSKESYKKLVNVIQSDSNNINNPTVFGGTENAVKKYHNTIVITAGKGQYIKLANAEVDGNIVVKGDQTGAGTVYLENVKVNKVNNYGGDVIVDDVADHSLYFINSLASNLQVNDTNGANIVVSSGRIQAINVSQSAGATGGITLDAGKHADIESVHIEAKGTKESKGITFKGDFSHSKVSVAGEGSEIKVDSRSVIQEIEVRAQTTIDALAGAVIKALNIATQEQGQVIQLKGDMANTIVNILKANEKIIVGENTVIKEIKKDPSVSNNIIVENNGKIESSTGVTIENNPPISTTPPAGTDNGTGSGASDNGGSIVVPSVPTVTLVSNNLEAVDFGGTVSARSSMPGTLYLIPSSSKPASKNNLDELVAAGKAQKVEVNQANSDTDIPTIGLSVGRYKVYAVSKQDVLSLPSAAIDYVPLGVNYVSQTSSDGKPNEVGGVQNTINWHKDSSIGLEDYSIQRRESRGDSDDGTSIDGNITIASKLPLDTESFTDMNAEAGKTYFYYVVSHSKRDDLNYTLNKLKSPGLMVITADDTVMPIDISSSLVAPMLKMGSATTGDIQGISLEADETIETTANSDVITLNGLHVTAVKAGKATVIVKVKKNGMVIKEGTIEITVVQDSSNSASFSSASYDANANTLVISTLNNIEEGSTFDLGKLTYSDEEATAAIKQLSDGYQLVYSEADVDAPGEYYYAAGTLTVLLTDSDAVNIESLPGFGSKGIIADTLSAAEGWNIDINGNHASAVSAIDVTATGSETNEELPSKAIVNLDFSTIYGTQARLDSKPVTVGDFTGNAKSFTIVYGEDRIPVTISWKLSTDFTKGQAMGSVVESAIQDYYYKKQGADGIMNKPLVAIGFTETFYLATNKVGADASFKLEGTDWNYFFGEDSAVGTNTDASKNKIFTINDGVNTATIKLNSSFSDISRMVVSINSQLKRANVSVTAEVIDDTHFKLVASSKDAKIIIEGTDKDYFF